MKYKIISSETEQDTLKTEVEYTYDDDSVETIMVYHYQPASKEYVLESIANRGMTEQRRINASAVVEQIDQALSADKGKLITISQPVVLEENMV